MPEMINKMLQDDKNLLRMFSNKYNIKMKTLVAAFFFFVFFSFA